MSLILFDFDGVLADTLNDLLQFGQEACNELGVRHTATQADLDALEIMSFATYGRQLEVPEALVDDFVRRCLQKVAQKETPPALFDGLGPVIERLAADHMLAIVTSNNRANVSAFLAHHGLTERVRTIYGVDAPGSKVEKIRRAKAEFTRAGESVWMVGDSVSDVRAAREAGVMSIAVGWGHQSVPKLLAEHPDALVHTPQELLEVIMRGKVESAA